MPTLLKIKPEISSQNKEYLRFQTSDLVQDIGQSTIPFIDTQPVEPIPHYPLSGASFYHKGADFSGGFLGLKLMTYNLIPYINTKIHVSVKDSNDSKHSRTGRNIRLINRDFNGRFYKCYNESETFDY